MGNVLISAFVFFSEKEKNKTGESENATNARFYGPARTCMELLKIGYTRNGFYLRLKEMTRQTTATWK